jgi:hypothetical protein
MIAKQSHSQDRTTKERQVKRQKAKVKRQKCGGTWFGCTNCDAGLHRHLTVLQNSENREGRL